MVAVAAGVAMAAIRAARVSIAAAIAANMAAAGVWVGRRRQNEVSAEELAMAAAADHAARATSAAAGASSGRASCES